MNIILTVTFLVAAATVVRSDDVSIIEKYLEYLMPYMEPCADEHEYSADDLRNVQVVKANADLSKLGCLRACVMKRMDALQDLKIQMPPVHKMIETVHAGKPDEIEKIKKIASDCVSTVEGETDECAIGLRYADCYIQKLMNP